MSHFKYLLSFTLLCSSLAHADSNGYVGINPNITSNNSTQTSSSMSNVQVNNDSVSRLRDATCQNSVVSLTGTAGRSSAGNNHSSYFDTEANNYNVGMIYSVAVGSASSNCELGLAANLKAIESENATNDYLRCAAYAKDVAAGNLRHINHVYQRTNQAYKICYKMFDIMAADPQQMINAPGWLKANIGAANRQMASDAEKISIEAKDMQKIKVDREYTSYYVVFRNNLSSKQTADELADALVRNNYVPAGMETSVFEKKGRFSVSINGFKTLKLAYAHAKSIERHNVFWASIGGAW